jgi:hypothetical protein
MVTWFLLHDAAKMGIRGFSGEIKFGIGKGVLEWYWRSKEAFFILERFLCLVSPSNVFGPPSGDQLRGATLVHNLANNSSKSSPCRENVATVWCPEGVDDLIAAAWSTAVVDPATEMFWPRDSKVGTAKHICPNWLQDHWQPMLQKMLPSGEGAFSCPEIWLVNLPCKETYLRDRPKCGPSCIEMLLDSPKGVKRYSKRPNGVMIAVFGMSAVATGIWW